MNKQFLNLGKALNKTEQKQINGGMVSKYCATSASCSGGTTCENHECVQIEIPRIG